MVDSIMDKGSNSNCEADVDDFLLSLDVLKTRETGVDLFQEQISPYQALVAELPQSVRSILSVCSFTELLDSTENDEQQQLSTQELNVLAYIGGYIVRKLRKKNM